MQNTFSPMMPTMTFARGGIQETTLHSSGGVVLRLDYHAAPRLMSSERMIRSNGQIPFQKQAAAAETAATWRGNVSEIRPPLRWGINE